MSATQRVSPVNAMPFGAFRVTPLLPPAMNLRESTFPSAVTLAMKPLLSLPNGSPLMFAMNQTFWSKSQRAASGA